MVRLVLVALLASCSIQHHHYAPLADSAPADSDVTPLGTRSVLHSSAPEFGHSIAVAGNGLRIAIAEYMAVNVYRREGSEWVHDGRLANGYRPGRSLAFSDDGTTLAVSSYDGPQVFIYKLVGSWTLGSEVTVDAVGRVGDSIALSGDGNTLAVAVRATVPLTDGRIQVRTSTTLRTIEASPPCYCEFGYAVAMSSNAQTIAIAAPPSALYFERTGMQTVTALPSGHDGRRVALSPDGAVALSMGPNGIVVVENGMLFTRQPALGGDVTNDFVVLVDSEGVHEYQRTGWQKRADVSLSNASGVVAVDNTASTIVVGGYGLDGNDVYVFTRN